ncbi:septal ring lytic transglycosylase RlpA family protein [Stappia sp. BW2]|jgi:rare lipoprotein A|uniref:septal ring lytic transglycosylase RlpA family protein n=1 Tax=Stappia sp. BW2 TaxID=2592622 RepID=UPI0011DED72A|nr:septal ring lytic transglycosylase RlpA family protein [Stappia sp. BW2]TYC79880.1 septal ring lytic transglycosylase RlpA family protein [Stappia sp. BW2]
MKRSVLARHVSRVALSGVLLLAAGALTSAQAGAYQQCGKASWYKLGGTTASGERANPNQLTAAHRSLPFGTLVNVTNLANGKTVTVRINDRGPYAKGRVIDVTWAAAKELGFVRKGITRVKVSSKSGKISSNYKQICR